MPRPSRNPAETRGRSVLVRVLGGVGVLGMASPLVWLVALAVMYFVARDELDGGLVFTVFGTTLLAMVVGVLLFALADRLDRRGRAPDDEDDTAPEQL